MKNQNDKRFTSEEMRNTASGLLEGKCLLSSYTSGREQSIDCDEISAMLRQAADVLDENTKLSTELRWAQDENLAKDEKARIIQSRIDNAERKVMELRKELYKFASKEIYDMSTSIIDALKGRK